MGSIGPETLGRLFDAHAPALRLYARQWCEGADADDAVQEAFVSLARQATCPTRWGPGCTGSSGTRPSRRPAAGNAAIRREAAVSTGEAWFSSVDDQIDARSATRYLAELDQETREVIVARLWGGLTFDQIARLQGCSLTTAHRRYQARTVPTSREAGTTMLDRNPDPTRTPERPGATTPLVGAVIRRPRPRPHALRGRPGLGPGAGRESRGAWAWRLATAAAVLVAVGLGLAWRAERTQRQSLELTLAARTPGPADHELATARPAPQPEPSSDRDRSQQLPGPRAVSGSAGRSVPFGTTRRWRRPAPHDRHDGRSGQTLASPRPRPRDLALSLVLSEREPPSVIAARPAASIVVRTRGSYNVSHSLDERTFRSWPSTRRVCSSRTCWRPACCRWPPASPRPRRPHPRRSGSSPSPPPRPHPPRCGIGCCRSAPS